MGRARQRRREQKQAAWLAKDRADEFWECFNDMYARLLPVPTNYLPEEG